MYLEDRFSSKIKNHRELSAILGVPPRNALVAMCHGNFDIVHPGHIRHLQYARSKADVLVASITADKFIDKANYRPHVPEGLRALNLAALEMVDYVVIDPNPTPLKALELLKPDFFAKGYEYAGHENSKTREEAKTIEEYGGEFLFTPGDIVFSSTKMIESIPPSIGVEKLLMMMESEEITFADLRDSVSDLSSIKVHVVGDMIIDSLTQCTMIGGGASKTPTMSVKYDYTDRFVGGAGIVAKHLSSAGARVCLSTVLGKDELGRYAEEDLRENGVELRPFYERARPTTHKNAIVCEGYRLLKVDTLDNRHISQATVDAMVDSISLDDSDGYVFSDFRHGIFSEASIPKLIEAIPKGTFRVADSQVASRWGNILQFEEFDLITPNEREARFALGDQDSVMRALAERIYNKGRCKSLILKCGPRGLMTQFHNVNRQSVEFYSIDSFAENVKDPVGSGDALLAYATLVSILTKNPAIAAIIGNFAAAIECEFNGNAPIKPALIIKKIDDLERRALFVGH